MIEDRNQASCVEIRAIPSSSAFTRCSYWPASSARSWQSMKWAVMDAFYWLSQQGLLPINYKRKPSRPIQMAVLRVQDDMPRTCGSPRWIGRSLACVCIKRKGMYERISINLTPAQEERLKRLKHRMDVYFDPCRLEHQEALRALWNATYPNQELDGLISEQWKLMGWQGKDPSTDFRGAGFISLENLLFFAKTFSASFQRLLNKQGGKRAAWEYPFAVAGVNITFMIIQMLDLRSPKARTFVRSVFIQMLAENEWTFDLLYCLAFMVMDKKWLEMNASYMEFNEVLRSTRTQLERELLMDDVIRIEDMPSYSLLS